MIVCSCNRLSEAQIVGTLQTEQAHNPRSPVQAYRCLGCAPDCGRCLITVRQILAEKRMPNCAVGCAQCPGATSAESAPAEPDVRELAAAA